MKWGLVFVSAVTITVVQVELAARCTVVGGQDDRSARAAFACTICSEVCNSTVYLSVSF
jgi:hypothetical protein